MQTNLNQNHCKCEHVRFTRDRAVPFENLWRGPRRSIPIPPHRGVHYTSDRGKLEIRQAGVAVVIDENGGLPKGHQ